MSNRKKFVGEAINRIDGLLKVTGAAEYATDYKIKNTAYAVIFKSEIAAGAIKDIDTSFAEKSAGVLTVITHKNAPKLNEKGGIRGGGMLQSAIIEYHGEHIGVVVAETFEQARTAARLIKVSYEKTEARTDFEKLEKSAVKPKDENTKDQIRGDVETVFSAAENKIEAVYDTPIEHHQPMEPHATIAVWEGEKLTLYNGSQIVNGAQNSAASTLNIKPENVRIITPHIGGGFGSKGGMWANMILAAVAAKIVNRPVKLALTRNQMVNSVGTSPTQSPKIASGGDEGR